MLPLKWMKNQYDQLNLEYGIPKELKGIDIVVLFSFFFSNGMSTFKFGDWLAGDVSGVPEHW